MRLTLKEIEGKTLYDPEEWCLLPKPRFLQEPHGVTTQKTPFFIVTAVKTSNLTLYDPVQHYNRHSVINLATGDV
jgi:hypothetical protein